MNLAFTALLILLLAVPGFAFIYAYRAERGRPSTSRPIADEMPLAVTVVVFIHLVWAGVFDLMGRLLFSTQVYPQAALILLANEYGKDGSQFQLASDAILGRWHPVFLSIYFATSCLFGAYLGRWFSWAVQRWRLDKRFPFLRGNDWYYLLRGDMPENMYLTGKYDGVRLTALVGNHIYWGIVVDFYLAPSGTLDTIVLAVPKRRKIGAGEVTSDGGPPADTEAEAALTYDINADFFVLKYSECQNLGVLLVRLSEDAPEIAPELPSQDEPPAVLG